MYCLLYFYSFLSYTAIFSPRTKSKYVFYRANLRFLGCTELSDLSKEDQQSHAFHLSLAALLGKGIYNFGELLAHPVLQTLNGTPNEWLINLLGKNI